MSSVIYLKERITQYKFSLENSLAKKESLESNKKDLHKNSDYNQVCGDVRFLRTMIQDSYTEIKSLKEVK
jgi:hypothetical protein